MGEISLLFVYQCKTHHEINLAMSTLLMLKDQHYIEKKDTPLLKNVCHDKNIFFQFQRERSRPSFYINVRHTMI